MNIKTKDILLKVILIVIALGIWVLVFQNATIHKDQTVQTVYVSGGNIDATIGNTVDVRGRVNIDNTVSVSIDEVLGKDGQKYYYNNNSAYYNHW